METQAPLTNTERRDDVLFLVQRYEASEPRPAELLDDDEKRRFLAGDAHTQRRLFYRLLCYGALAAQPAPEALVRADWQRLRAAGLPDDIFDRRFDIERFAAAAPVARLAAPCRQAQTRPPRTEPSPLPPAFLTPNAARLVLADPSLLARPGPTPPGSCPDRHALLSVFRI